MKFEYVVFHKNDLCSQFTSDFPLPQIQVGNVLHIESAAYTQRIGENPLIERIEVYVFAPVDQGELQRFRVSVYVSQQAV